VIGVKMPVRHTLIQPIFNIKRSHVTHRGQRYLQERAKHPRPRRDGEGAARPLPLVVTQRGRQRPGRRPAAGCWESVSEGPRQDDAILRATAASCLPAAQVAVDVTVTRTGGSCNDPSALLWQVFAATSLGTTDSVQAEQPARG